MEKLNEKADQIDKLTYPELVAALQGFFETDSATVKRLLEEMYSEDLSGEKDMVTGFWNFKPAGEKVIITKNTGYRYLIGTQQIKRYNRETGEMEPQKILRIYKKWYNKPRMKNGNDKPPTNKLNKFADHHSIESGELQFDRDRLNALLEIVD